MQAGANRIPAVDASAVVEAGNRHDSVMNTSKEPFSERISAEAASEMVDRWRRSHAMLEKERLQALRGLGERDAALRFARLLQINGSYPLRPTSGLVEQQRILARRRKRS